MRKNTLFLSIGLTTFILAVLFGVVSAYQKTTRSAQIEAAPSALVAQNNPASIVQPADSLISMVPASTISPEQAAVLAAQTLGHDDVYSVESTTYEGTAAYLVTFSSGDLIYLSPTGQILAITQPEPVVIVINQPGRDPDRDRPARDSGGSEDHDGDHEDQGDEGHSESEEHGD